MQRHYRTGDQALVREINLSIVLNHLSDTSPLSRARLAEMTGLNKTTVSSLVQELLERRFLREIGREPSGAGRPAIMLELNPHAGCIIGTEIGVDFIAVILTDFRAQILWRRQEDSAHLQGQEAVLARAMELIREALAVGWSTGTPVLGLGLGVPGLVDGASGTLIFAPNLQWHNVPIKEILSRQFPGPIFVENDANAAAWGEHYFGAAQRAKNFIYLHVGVGLGAGIVIDGGLYRGRSGYAGEIGHMTLVLDGEPCHCGNRGCWETLVSQEAVIKRVRRAIENGASSRVSDLVEHRLERVSVPLIVQAAEEGDSITRQALQETGLYLGIGIANLINAFNPELVVFGGVLSLASPFLLPAIQQAIGSRSLAESSQTIRVEVSTHGRDACVIGCIALVLHDILSQPTRTLRADAEGRWSSPQTITLAQ
ncbi:MAG: ROK family transcriptional regulator [Chloroflexi bacterium]|nr:ROK family transcriptional regulator [Chloroflexota bacterium]